MAQQERKIIGQCPICKETFRSQHELRTHMEDPPNHPPAEDYDTISTGSFGELSSDEEHQDEFYKEARKDEFFDEEQHDDYFKASPPPAPFHNPFEIFSRPEGSAIGILYCPTCDRTFGNISHYQRHFMFSTKHGEEPTDVRDLYYKLWTKSWRSDPLANASNPDPSSAELMEGIETDAEQQQSQTLHTESN